MNLLEKLRRKKKVILSSKEMVQVAQGKVDEAFIMFTQADEAINEANDSLFEVVEESEKQIKALEAKIEDVIRVKNDAEHTIVANKNLSKNLQVFVK